MAHHDVSPFRRDSDRVKHTTEDSKNHIHPKYTKIFTAALFITWKTSIFWYSSSMLKMTENEENKTQGLEGPFQF